MPVREPWDGPVTTLYVRGLLSASDAVRVIDFAMSSGVVTDWGDATGAWLNTMSNGAPATQLDPVPVTVPLAATAMESPTPVPVPSPMPQRAMSPEPDVSCWLMPSWISDAERARFQIRASSSTPAKWPAATPVELRAMPRPASWMLSDRGGLATASVSVPSSLPSR